MRNPNADENNLSQSDFWCDFCHRPWTDESIPMIEGHQGSIVCGHCLTLGYRAMIVDEEPTPDAPETGADGPTCRMCLEQRSSREPMWRSPMFEDAWMCRRCARLAAQAIEKSSDFAWSRPGKEG